MSGLLLALSAATATPPLPVPPSAPGPGWSLVWSDDFNGSTIDAKRWTLATDCWGGGNAEQQCYTDRAANAAVSDGLLVITAREETFTSPAFPEDQRTGSDKRGTASRPFTSARLTTQGKAAWRYGRIEVRARLPQGQGMWPAIWMLPEDNLYGTWAASGEIDIMEAVNLGERCKKGVPGCPDGIERGILGTLHFGGTWPANRHRGATTAMPGALDGFHTYSVEWSPRAITWFIDGKPFQTQRPGDWSTRGSDKPGAPFDQRFHLVLNLAVGGHLAEDRNKGGISRKGFPKQMAIDWVHVWQCAGDPASTADCETSGD